MGRIDLILIFDIPKDAQQIGGRYLADISLSENRKD